MGLPKGNIHDIPDFRDTIESQTLPDAGVHAKPMLVDGVANDRMPTGTDSFSLSAASRLKYGIGDNEEIGWALNTSMSAWSQHLAYDRIDDVMDSNPGSRVVTYDGGKTVRRQDLILISRPKDARDIINARETNELRAGDNRAKSGDYEEITPLRTDDDHQRSKDANLRDIPDLLKNSPTHGMSYEEAFSYRSEEQIRADENFHASRGSTSLRMSLENQAHETANKMRDKTTGKQSFGGLTGAADNWERSGDKARGAKAAAR